MKAEFGGKGTRFPLHEPGKARLCRGVPCLFSLFVHYFVGIKAKHAQGHQVIAREGSQGWSEEGEEGEGPQCPQAVRPSLSIVMDTFFAFLRSFEARNARGQTLT